MLTTSSPTNFSLFNGYCNVRGVNNRTVADEDNRTGNAVPASDDRVEIELDTIDIAVDTVLDEDGGDMVTTQSSVTPALRTVSDAGYFSPNPRTSTSLDARSRSRPSYNMSPDSRPIAEAVLVATNSSSSSRVPLGRGDRMYVPTVVNGSGEQLHVL